MQKYEKKQYKHKYKLSLKFEKMKTNSEINQLINKKQKIEKTISEIEETVYINSLKQKLNYKIH